MKELVTKPVTSQAYLTNRSRRQIPSSSLASFLMILTTIKSFLWRKGAMTPKLQFLPPKHVLTSSRPQLRQPHQILPMARQLQVVAGFLSHLTAPLTAHCVVQAQGCQIHYLVQAQGCQVRCLVQAQQGCQAHCLVQIQG